MDAHGRISCRSRARSNLPFGERGSSSLTSTTDGTMYSRKVTLETCDEAVRGRVLLRDHRDDQRDALSEYRVIHSERDRVAHETCRVRRLLDLGRAHPVARRLDHLVRPADEIEEPLLVGDDGVAGPDRDL